MHVCFHFQPQVTGGGGVGVLLEWDPILLGWGWPLPARAQPAQLHPRGRKDCKTDRGMLDGRKMPHKENQSGRVELGFGTGVKGRRPGCGVGAPGRREPGRRSKHSEGSRATEGGPGKGWAPYFCHHPPPQVSRCASPAERRPLCSSNMICNFRQTFEVPDICIMWASLLATGNSCLAFPRLNCNYTRPLPGGGGGGRG